ncbi:uncharacterized protein LOC116019348 isoform X2 [Ipomoea triloba]|uniref:uncharacterized protein LOC116019348 isoform X1 n=1 Tax=Ipomoea triloba TaxID=35885 RepID=UPI00125DA943|nr:uncharacterized protein LOC116019348 isoform X1 [Ipomoea triloba]XP_031115379.1 uncharacterized protein LOC116019348 isoform X1 [Ipomoea triloba]XP_031115381.1 uncharacterized protein LOC116019348 isoform X2 [Ipomoea triloba]
MHSPSMDRLKDHILRRGIDLEGLKITYRDLQGKNTSIVCDEDLAHCFECLGAIRLYHIHLRLSRRTGRSHRTQQCKGKWTTARLQLFHPISGNWRQSPASSDNRRILKEEIKLEP